MARRTQGLKVDVPKPGSDELALGRVGIIAAAGFAIGLVWPWLAGVKLVPSPPRTDMAGPVASAAPPAASAAPAASRAAPVVEAKLRESEGVEVGDALVVSCRSGAGAKIKECDKVDFDRIAKPLLQKLSNCPAASGASKVLSIGFDLDFEKNAVVKISEGKSTTFPKEKTKTLIGCAEKEFAGVKLDGIDHEHARYSIYYLAEFLPPGTVEKAADEDGEKPTDASGLATVGWDVALVRDQPDAGEIRARLRYGTRVVVTARQGKWYRIKYDSKGTEGWVHKNAIGL